MPCWHCRRRGGNIESRSHHWLAGAEHASSWPHPNGIQRQLKEISMGSVYARKRSPYLWIKYHQNGRAVRESTGTKNETVARRMLRTREGDVERGIPIDPKVGRITFDEAAEDMLNDYK